jgi:hypothetical protein
VTRYAGACPHAEVDIVPELPEVETVCRGLAATLEGRRLHRVIQRRPDLRFPLPVRFADRLQGRRIDRVYRRAKFILIRLDDDNVILAHLGMSGRMVVGAAPVAEFDPHDHVIFETDNGTAIRFNDARRFGFMHLVAASELDRHPLLSALGPEPLGNNFNGPVLAAALRGKKTPIKAAIVDQRVVAGIGNIYASKACSMPASRRAGWRVLCRASAPNGLRRRSSVCWRMRSRPAAPPCATSSRRMVSSGISSIAGRSMNAKDNPARAAGAMRRRPAAFAASCNPAVRLSIVPIDNAEVDTRPCDI